MRSLLIVLLALCAATAWSAVPQQINYQGFLTDPAGAPLDTVVSMTFALYDAASNGTQLWTETQPSCTVRAGLFNVLLGSVTAIPDSFNRAEVWLGVTVGSNSEMTPRTRFVSVPYAYRVGTVDGASGGTISGDVNVVGRANIGLDNANPGLCAFVAGRNDSALGDYSTVAGGYHNTASGSIATVSGGSWNEAIGIRSTVGGGSYNEAVGYYATIGGGYNNYAQAGFATVAGGKSNFADSTATVGGGGCNYARGDYAVIAGGGGSTEVDSNSASGVHSAIGGGRRNSARSRYATVGGGELNDAYGYCATVGGGGGNHADGNFATVGGGFYSVADSDNATVAGGYDNAATNYGATVAGGVWNMATGYGSTIGGGHSNRAQGDYSVIAGGGGQYGTDGNSASGISSAVLGGELNHADGNFATVGGGRYNEASGWASTVAGGFDNLASGNYSFAAGRQAQAYGNGSWVWGDATDDTVGSWNNNEFVVRASGGIYLYTNAAKTSGMKLTAGSSSWAGVSDSTRKRNIRLVDTRSILEKVTALPIKQWSYKAQDPAVEHVGPMAQDFWNQFHLGDDSLSISTIDPDGIALAAIQELQKQNVALQKRVEQLEHQLQQPTAGNTSADQTSIIQTQ